VNLGTGERINMAEQSSYTYRAARAGVAETRFRIEVVKLNAAQKTVTYTLKPGWNLISVPVEPEVTNALAALGGGAKLLNVYQYYEGNYYAADKADIQAGLGYWIYVADNAEIAVSGAPVESPVRVPLTPGWNTIGNPFESEVAWGDNITLACGGASYTLSQAAAAGVTDGKLYRFDGAKYIAAGTLEQWNGYFLKTAAACDILLQP
jgi:hypothetical protein